MLFRSKGNHRREHIVALLCARFWQHWRLFSRPVGSLCREGISGLLNVHWMLLMNMPIYSMGNHVDEHT